VIEIGPNLMHALGMIAGAMAFAVLMWAITR